MENDFNVIKMLGQGTYAQVFLGSNIKTKQLAAIKVSRGSTAMCYLSKEKTILEMFDHPAIPKVIDYKEGASKSYLIMQYFEGDTLDVFIEKNGWLPEDTARKWFVDLMSAISLIHSKKIAHRDIKPQNILINDKFEIMLIDFNISKKGKDIHYDQVNDDVKHKHKFKYRFLTQVSTPLYAAPEIVNRSLYTESVDIWGAGVILYLVLFGKIPFRTKSNALHKEIKDCESDIWLMHKGEQKEYTADLHQQFIDQIKESLESSDEIKDLLLHMLAFDSNDRLTSDECLEHPWVFK